MHVEDIEYEAGGTTMVGHLAVDDEREGRRPAVLLCHEGPGIDDHVKGRAERLAGLGYTAFALDYHGGGKPVPMEQMMERLAPLMGDPQRTRALATAGLDVLLDQPTTDRSKVAAIGYCFGGSMAIELGRSGADLRAIVGFHAGVGPSATPADNANITGSLLVCLGTDDPFVPREARVAFEDELQAAGVADWRIELYGGVGHSFTNPKADEAGMPGIGFHAASDRRSWRSMLDLFDEVLV